MTIKPEIRTLDEIEVIVRNIRGTWVKRSNARKRLAEWSNKLVNEKILEAKGKVRDLKALGAKEQDLRFWYSEITKLEVKIL